ncbi:MAG: hypothetical protein ACLFU9_05945, partial [Candidatus Bathyarchaeia archaeon]
MESSRKKYIEQMGGTISMKVSRKTNEDTVYFVISEAMPKCHDAIKHLFYEKENNDFVKGFPSEASHVDKC